MSGAKDPDGCAGGHTIRTSMVLALIYGLYVAMIFVIYMIYMIYMIDVIRVNNIISYLPDASYPPEPAYSRA